ncbi:hypothetical protein Tco_1106215 [Tanacetum coccineum]
MVLATTSLVGFSGEIKWPLGQITLQVKVGDGENSTLAWMDFMVGRSSKIVPMEYAMISGPKDQPPPVSKVKEERTKVAINPEHTEQTVMIGSNLSDRIRTKLYDLLQRSLDVFAWTLEDMTGVPIHIAEHRLNVRESYQPIRQKKRGQAAERNVAINDEVNKLVAAGIMKEVHYHDWLSNPVMVKKHDSLSSAFWMHTRGTIRYKWRRKMKKR